MASTTNFTCEKCGKNFSIMRGSLMYTERTNEDDLESVIGFEEALADHKGSECGGNVVFQGFGNID